MQTIHRNLIGDGACVLTFDRPDSPVNIFDVPTLKELDAQLGDLAGVRVLILASAKKSVFVAGADIHLFTQMSMEELTAFVEMGQAVFNRLAALKIPTVAAIHGAKSYLIEAAEDIRPEWITGDVGVTAGASTPEHVVMACVERVRALGNYRLEEFRLVEERVMFPLPGELLAVAREKGVAVGAGNERAADRAEAEFKIRHH